MNVAYTFPRHWESLSSRSCTDSILASRRDDKRRREREREREERRIQTPDTHFSTDSPHWLPLTGESSGRRVGLCVARVRVYIACGLFAHGCTWRTGALVSGAFMGVYSPRPVEFLPRIYPRCSPGYRMSAIRFSGPPERSFGSDAFPPLPPPALPLRPISRKKIARSFRESGLLLR